jgi:hypothetical protein
MEKVQNPSISECDTPSSEPFRIYFTFSFTSGFSLVFHPSFIFIFIYLIFTTDLSRAVTQAVSRWLLTAATRVRSKVKSSGICGGQSGAGAVFLRILQFPWPVLIPSTTPHSSSIIRCWYNRSNSGRGTKWTQSHPTSRN